MDLKNKVSCLFASYSNRQRGFELSSTDDEPIVENGLPFFFVCYEVMAIFIYFAFSFALQPLTLMGVWAFHWTALGTYLSNAYH